MRIIITYTLLLMCAVAKAKTIKIAVVDTGFDMSSTWSDIDQFNERNKTNQLNVPILCDKGHEDFTNADQDPLKMKDTHGHGTHVAGIIASYLHNIDYCLVIFKYFDPKASNHNDMINIIKSFRKAIDLDVDFINYSGGGLKLNIEEQNVLQEAFIKGIIVVAAAGNETSNVDRNPYYPGSYATVISVGSVEEKSRKIANYSNYGKSIDYFLPGTRVMSLLPNNTYGMMSGTSQSTAKVTGILALRYKYWLELMELLKNNPEIMKGRFDV